MVQLNLQKLILQMQLMWSIDALLINLSKGLYAVDNILFLQI